MTVIWGVPTLLVVLGRLRNDPAVLLGQCRLTEAEGHEKMTGALDFRLRDGLPAAGLRMRNRRRQDQQRSAGQERCEFEPVTGNAVFAVPAQRNHECPSGAKKAFLGRQLNVARHPWFPQFAN